MNEERENDEMDQVKKVMKRRLSEKNQSGIKALVKIWVTFSGEKMKKRDEFINFMLMNIVMKG